MKNKIENVVVIAVIVVIVVISASVITWLVSTKMQPSPIQQTATQPATTVQTQQVAANPSAVQEPQQVSKPIINLNKFTKEESEKKFNHVAVEYQKDASDSKKILRDFVDEMSIDDQVQYDRQYKVSYLSPKYLTVSSCGGMAPCSEYLFDLIKLQEVTLQFPMDIGNYAFFEDEKYIAFEGIGRVAQPGISIEMIDGKKVNCLISGEEVSDVVVKNGVMSFTEDSIVKDKDGTFKDVSAKKDIIIADFCNDK